MIQITINDAPLCVDSASTLAAALAAKGITSPAGLAVALNGATVLPAAWSSTLLRQGDSILVFQAFYGG